MSANVPTCRSCGTALHKGFLPDFAHGAIVPGTWHSGEPVYRYFKSFGIKIQPDRQKPITAFRCERCGLIDLYAP